MGKPVRKLSVKKETLRQLGALTGEQLQKVAGGTLAYTTYCFIGFQTSKCIGGILGGGGGTLVTCKTCEPDTSYCLP